ncbi:MAG: hypothetical protein Kow00121_09120 [Elainellaceae cyanobacterium]
MSNEKAVVESLSEEYKLKDFGGYFQSERHEMLNYVPRDAKKILDVGCAGGSFGQLLKQERFVEVWGIEPNETAAIAATPRLDKVICDVFSDTLALPEAYFDCIIFNDVLEHLVDPYSALEYCHKLLTNRGVIVASIPNVRYFDNTWNLLILKKWEYTNWGILDKTHLRFFTCRSIEQTFSELEYSIERLEGINPLEKFHPHHLKRFKVLNWLFPQQVGDMRYLQFAVVARPKLCK